MVCRKSGVRAHRRSTPGWRQLTGVLVAMQALVACIPEKPDLTTQIFLDPTWLQPGDGFELSNRACNTGTVASTASGVSFVWQPVGMPQLQVPIGWRPLPPLAPGACDEESTALDAPFGFPDGAYEVVAVADREQLVDESREQNNNAHSTVIGYGYGPDLVIASLSSPATAESGATATFEAEVCNAGNSWSAASKLAVLLSDDDSISIEPPMPDWWLGELDVPELPSGACAPVAGQLMVSVPDGTYTIGAITDSADAVFELIESNNVTAAGILAIGYGPDLVVSQVSGPFSTPMGGSFPVDLEICNQGTAPSNPSTVSVHLSLDDEIDPDFPDPASGDPMVGTLPVPWLDRGECHSGSVDAYAWVPSEGAWTLGAYVDSSNEIVELLETNNATAGALIGVGNGPDYVVDDLTAPPSAADNFEVEVEVCNRGTAPGNPVAVTLYLSADEMLDPEPPGVDPEIGYDTAPGLMPGQCDRVTVYAVPSFPADGAYRLVARVDPFQQEPELIETNNDHWGDVMGIGLGPDLVVTGVVGPPSTQNHSPFTASATVCNQGTMPSGPSNVSFYHSIDSHIVGFGTGPGGPGDFYAGELPVSDLVPGACLTVEGEVYASVDDDGAYSFGAIVDDPDWVSELIETNNTTVGAPMGVGFGPDLRIESISGPPSAMPGASVQLDFEVCNDGTAMSSPASLTLYLSIDAEIDPSNGGPPFGSDEWLAEVPVPSLIEGDCLTGSAPVNLYPPDPGPYFVGGIVDEWNAVPELIETNNDHAEDIIGIGNAPDFVVASVSAPPSSLPSAPLPITLEICNEGTQAGSTAVSLYLSEDAAIESSYFSPLGDPLVGIESVSTLLPGECRTEVFETYPFVPDGVWFVGAIVDDGEYETELREDNNAGVGEVVGIGSGPDLVIASIDVPPSVTAGVPFTASVEVCNQGNVLAPLASLSFYHSADAVLTGQFAAPIGPDLLLAFGSTANPLPPSVCDTTQMQLTTYAEPGSWHFGVIVDEDLAISELIESNNALLAPPHGVNP